jgi:hypothetical protein
MAMIRIVAVACVASVLACASSSNGSTSDATTASAGADSTAGGAVSTAGIADSATATEALVAIHATLEELTSTASVDTKADTVDLTVACDSGTARSTLTTTNDGAGSATATHDLEFSSCRTGDERLTGALEWSTLTWVSLTGGRALVRFHGALAYEGPTYAGNFSFNELTIVAETTRAGTTYSVTGTFSVGGTTYSFDQSFGGSFFN